MAFIRFTEDERGRALLWLAKRVPVSGYYPDLWEVPSMILDALREAGFSFEEVPLEEALKIKAAAREREKHAKAEREATREVSVRDNAPSV